jgi:hypothetical protein
MRPGEQLSADYYESFKPFVAYYGDYAYADKIISAAFDGTSVTLNGKTFNLDQLDFDGRAGKLIVMSIILCIVSFCMFLTSILLSFFNEIL